MVKKMFLEALMVMMMTMTMMMKNEMYLGVVQDTPVFVLVAFVISTCNQCGEGKEKEAQNERACDFLKESKSEHIMR